MTDSFSESTSITSEPVQRDDTNSSSRPISLANLDEVDLPAIDLEPAYRGLLPPRRSEVFGLRRSARLAQRRISRQ